jgi:hypothetical protein
MSASTLNPGKPAAWRPLALAGLLAFWLFLLYGRTLYQKTPDAQRWLWTLLGPLNLTLDFLNPVFRSPAWFAGSYLLGLGLVTWGILKVVRSWPARMALGLSGAAALAFPLVLPATYGSYLPPVRMAAPGYEVRWLTEPANLYSSALKQAQHIHEAECDQHLAGWSADGSLAYTSECWPGVWRYDPVTEQRRTALLGWAERFDAASLQRWEGSQYLFPPAGLDQAGRYPFLTLERSTSPDGRWEAVVVRWFYGPSDVILVGPDD